MIFSTTTLLACALGLAAVAAGMGPLIRLLRRSGTLDVPNQRSSHKKPTPVGGGLLVVAVLLPLWLVLADRPLWHVVVPAAALALISWIDDRRGLSAALRFPAHILAVAAALWAEPGLAAPLLPLLPQPAPLVVTGLAWVWFLNLFNFMDGIDGITGVETLSIGGGVAAVALVQGLAPDLGGLGLAALAVAVGFLVWNWHPAKVFLGDVGSVPLGFLLGWLLLALAAAGAWTAALVLPAYYLADATLTLLRRLARGQKPWQAHRDHFYQMPTAGGRNHARTAGAVLACNLVLAAIAIAGARFGAVAMLAAAALAVGALLALFQRGRSTPPA